MAAGDFACVNPDEPAAHDRIAAVRADGPGYATLVRLMFVDRGRSVHRAANPGWPDMEMARANESMLRVVVVFVGRAVRGACPSLPAGRPGSGRRRLPRHVTRWGESGSDGRREALRGKGC